MRQQQRKEEPSTLRENSKKWSDEWVKNRSQPSAERKSFIWHQVDNQKTNHLLLPLLREQTNSHCSFCDGYPVSDTSLETIEHFRPKDAFPELAYTWSNLFYCCDQCQNAKRNQFDDLLLKPDHEDYNFIEYFRFDFTTGEIKPNPKASSSSQEQATKTIEIYGLNEHGLPGHRQRTLRHFLNQREPAHAEDFAYRDYLEAQN